MKEHVQLDIASSGIHPVFSRTGHNVELILQTEVPHVYTAFRMSGYTPSQVGFSLVLSLLFVSFFFS